MQIRLEQKQTLDLKMTTQLRQAIELLQFSSTELHEFVHKQVEENPFIDWNESPTIHSSDSSRLSTHDIIAATAVDEKNLYDDLLEQLSLLDLAPNIRKLTEFLIYNLDEDGYFRMEEREVVEGFGLTKDIYDTAMHTLHQLEPIGVGARDLAECLLLQAKHLAQEDDVLHRLIAYHLDDIANQSREMLAAELNVAQSVLEEKISYIQSHLHPRPASHIGRNETVYIKPDIIVRQNEVGEWIVDVQDDYLSKLSFHDPSTLYESNIEEVAAYIRSYRVQYNWLMSSLEKRRATLLHIMNVIVDKQAQVFEKGLQFVQALTLRAVAEEISMHESTVSRATANKYVETPIGTFSLRKFFSHGLPTVSGEVLSQIQVKAKIGHFIEREDKSKPLSDERLTQLLKEEGIIISRRTIAKYRNEMKIKSSSKRRLACRKIER